MDKKAAELLLAALYLDPSPERQEGLKRAVQEARNCGGLLPALERHGLILLFRHHLEQAAIELPAALGPLLEARARELSEQARRARSTLQHVLRECARTGVELTLRADASVALGADPAGELLVPSLEFFVRSEQLAGALAACASAGALVPEAALPVWWQRLTDVRVALEPCTAFSGGLELSWRLHHPSLLFTAEGEAILGRRKPLAQPAAGAFGLDPLDELLELVTRVAVACGQSLGHGRGTLLRAAMTPEHPLRLAWVLGLRHLIETRESQLSVRTLLARAREWSAEAALRAVLECLQMGLGFTPAAREWVRQVLLGLASSPASAEPVDLGPDVIERLPRWLSPSTDYIVRRAELGPGSTPRDLQRARARHVAAVLLFLAAAGLAYPCALLGRRLARTTRQRARACASSPERLQELGSEVRANARLEQERRPRTPQTVSLLPREETAFALPEKYRAGHRY
jgi:hypothetical protein